MSSDADLGMAADRLREIIARLRGGALDRDLVDSLESLAQEIQQEHRMLERRLKWLETSQRNFDLRLSRFEQSQFFRLLRLPGMLLSRYRGRLGRQSERTYQLWLEREMRERSESREVAETGPLISILLRLCDPKREWLEAAVRSLATQTYPNWELCVCDDSCRDGWVINFLAARAAEDSRVRFVRSESPLGISGALNAAGALAGGSYVGVLTDEGVLAPHALSTVARMIMEQRPALVYSDEDRLDSSGRRTSPLFKPDWDPELLLSCMYPGRFLAISRTAVERAGWFRSEFDGAQDYDLVLRIAEAGGAVAHIPHILYHGRDGPSTCGSGHEASRRALEAAVARRGWRGRIESAPAGKGYRLRRTGERDPLVSIVICSRSARLLERCLRAIDRNTGYSKREVVIVRHLTVRPDPRMDRLLADCRPTIVPYEGPFNFSAMTNSGARSARGEILMFLNDDVEPLVSGWLEAIVRQVERPEVGIVGAKLLYPSGAVQHAGIAIGISDGAGHPRRFSKGSAGWWPWTDLTRNVSAVTGACLAVRKQVFTDLGGFDPAFPENYNDVDLCLRTRQAGYSVLCEPAALLRHYEAQTRTAVTRYEERELFYERWGRQLERGDPFYNPNLTREREDASLRIER